MRRFTFIASSMRKVLTHLALLRRNNRTAASSGLVRELGGTGGEGLNGKQFTGSKLGPLFCSQIIQSGAAAATGV